MSDSNGNLPDDLKKRIAHGVTWSTLGSGVSQGLALVAGVLLARWLGQVEYGGLGVIQTNVVLFSVFAGPTLGVTTAKFVAEYRSVDGAKAAAMLNKTLQLGLYVSVGFAAVFLLFASVIAESLLHRAELTVPLQLSSIAVFFAGLDGVQRGGLTGFEAFRSIAFVNVIKGAITIPVLLGLVHYYGLNGAVLGLGAIGALGCLGNRLAIDRERRSHGFPTRTVLDQVGMAEIRSLYWPTLLAALVQLPVSWLLATLLVRREDGVEEMALLNAATNWRLAILFLPTLINTTFIPMLNGALGDKNTAQFKKLSSTNIAASVLVAVVPAVVIVALSGPIMRIHGPGFEVGSPVLVVLAVSAVLAAASSPIGNMLVALRKAWYGTGLNASTAVVTVTACMYLLDRGAYGVAMAWLIGYGWHTAASFAVLIGLTRRSRP